MTVCVRACVCVFRYLVQDCTLVGLFKSRSITPFDVLVMTSCDIKKDAILDFMTAVLDFKTSRYCLN